jgi:hypothetical protein
VEPGNTNQGDEISWKQKNSRIKLAEERIDETQEQTCENQQVAMQIIRGEKMV